MAKEKPGIMVYWEMFDVLERVKPEKLKPLLQAMRNLSQYGELPDFRGDEALELVWPLIEQKIAADDARYEKVRQQRIDAINSRWEKERAKSSPNNERIQPYTNVYEDKRNIPTTTSPAKSSTTTTAAGASTPGTPRQAYGLYKNVFLTDEEYKALERDFANIDRTINKLSMHMESNGKTYVNHEATVRKWAMEDAEKETASQPSGDWCSNRTPYTDETYLPPELRED